MSTTEDTKHAALMKIGKNALASIREMVAALECDYDRLEELREAVKSDEFRTSEEDDEERSELADLEEAAGECKSREDAEQRIHEDPLSIEVRSGWVELSDFREGLTPEEFNILLTTGGPAVRIMGELQNGEPTRAYLQVQDWGTPWTDYYESGIGDTLMTYVRCFCFDC